MVEVYLTIILMHYLNSRIRRKRIKAQHGIGLSIIKDAVNYHHGSITLLPSKQGVHFHIILVDKA